MHAVRKSSPLPGALMLALVGLLAAALAPSGASAQGPVVRAVLFYSPTCPHCHKVMTEDLPPLAERYGDRLQIVGVDVTTPGGQGLLRATVGHFGIPDEDVGVPLMVAGETFLMGAVDIPEQLPGIVARALAEEGVDWPRIDAVRDALAAEGLLEEPRPVADPAPEQAPDEAGPTATSEPSAADPREALRAAPPADVAPSGETPPAGPAPTVAVPEGAGPGGLAGSLTSGEEAAAGAGVMARMLRDPVGNAVAVLVLLGLVGALAVSARMARAGVGTSVAVPPWLVPSLSVLGMGVAAYLSMVEVTGRSAVCGPVGDCNAVQQSPYAHLFGVLPVGILGLVGYAAILAAWGVERRGPAATRRPTLRIRWAMAFVATAFSVYLTFLEPFVIGATCMWCVTSAVLVAALLLATTLELRGSAQA